MRSTRVRGTVLRRNLVPLLDLVARLVWRPALRSGDFAKLKRQARAALVARLDDDQTLGALRFRAELFGDHPYGRTLGGTAATLRRIRVEHAREFYRRNLESSPFVVGVAGECERRVGQREDQTAVAEIEAVGHVLAHGGCIRIVGRHGDRRRIGANGKGRAGRGSPAGDPAAAEALMRNITYRNVSDDPATAPRSVRFVLTDGDGGATTTDPLNKDTDDGGGGMTGTLIPVSRDDLAVTSSPGKKSIIKTVESEGSDYRVLTVDGGDEDTYFHFALDPADLIEGTNVLAVEIHQHSGASNDVSFDLQLIGNYFDEARLLNVGHRFQQATDWHQQSPAVCVEEV